MRGPQTAPAAAGQHFKSRLEAGRRFLEMALHPERFCRVCQDHLPGRRRGGNCEDCSRWAGVIVRAHESARVRALFS